MATVTGLTAARMLTIEAASVVGGHIDVDGHLILEKYDESEIDAGYMLASLPDATTTVKGKVELATDAEAITGTDTVRAVTPSALSAKLADLISNLASSLAITGEIKIWAGFTPPAGWELCNGEALNRTTYANLFNVLAPVLGTATMTIASPAVVTKTAHGLAVGDRIFFTTTGALPTGVTADTTTYYVIAAGHTADTFQFSATSGGSAINTSGSQSGVHTLRRAPYGIGSSTTFLKPDLVGRVPVGQDIFLPEFDNIGQQGGENYHTLTAAEMPTHTHTQNSHTHTEDAHSHSIGGAGGTHFLVDGAGTAGTASITTGGGGYAKSVPQTAVAGIQSTTPTNQNTGDGDEHNNVQPYTVVQYIIKT